MNLIILTIRIAVLILALGWAGSVAAGTTRYAYDAAGRLTRADYGTVIIVYTYDANGNLTRRSTQAANPGKLRVNITPDTAQWRRTGAGAWRNSGTTEDNVTPGDYQVEFTILAGYNDQNNIENVLIESGKTRTLDVAYTANANTYAVNALVSGQGGRVTGAKTYQHNALVRLEAIADQGYRFAHWKNAQGRIVSTDTVMEFRATTGQSFTAHFRRAGLGGMLMLLLE